MKNKHEVLISKCVLNGTHYGYRLYVDGKFERFYMDSNTLAHEAMDIAILNNWDNVEFVFANDTEK